MNLGQTDQFGLSSILNLIGYNLIAHLDVAQKNTIDKYNPKGRNSRIIPTVIILITLNSKGVGRRVNQKLNPKITNPKILTHSHFVRIWGLKSNGY